MYWPVLDEAADEADLGRDIGAFMHHWVASIGFPVLTVTESEDSKGIIVRQDRFLEDGKPEDKDNETIWCDIYALSGATQLKLFRSVPLSLLSSRGLDRGAVLSKREDTFEVETNHSAIIGLTWSDLSRLIGRARRTTTARVPPVRVPSLTHDKAR